MIIYKVTWWNKLLNRFDVDRYYKTEYQAKKRQNGLLSAGLRAYVDEIEAEDIEVNKKNSRIVVVYE